MSNHEFWNELGNLYFLNGAYQPAIHAYSRSIELDGRFGRPYSNLAMAFVQIGKYAEAIKLYRHSIDLLSDDVEKAVTWNKLGTLYRQARQYDLAVVAYQQADLLNPQQSAENGTETAVDTKFPLTVSMPDLDIETILTWQTEDAVEETVEVLDINVELEVAEEQDRLASLDDEFMPSEPDIYFQMNETAHETISTLQSEWRLAYAVEMTSTEMAAQIEKAMASEELVFEEMGMIVPVDLQFADMNEQINEIPIPDIGDMIEPIEAIREDEVEEEEVLYGNSNITESTNAAALNETQLETAEYSQIEYPLMELSEAEKNSLQMDISKYKHAAQKNPRNYQVWELLGDAYKSAGMYKDAIKAIQTAISINSTKPAYYYRLGLIYAAERREAEAVSAFQRVLELDPNYAQAHASLAGHYRKMGLDELAQSHIEMALKSQFEEETEYNRACLEAICGNYDHALELLKVALETKQTYVNWAQIDPDLDSLHKDQRFHDLLSSHAAKMLALAE